MSAVAYLTCFIRILLRRSPFGVTARWTAASENSVATARKATRMAAPSRPSSPYVLTLMIGSPSDSAPASGASVAVAITFTAEVLIPPKMSGRARGNSIRRTICAPVIPMPRAASTVSRFT